MRRGRATLLFSILTVGLLAYAAWCGRSFYLTPKVHFPSDMPGNFQEVANQWHQANELPEPSPFSWQQFAAELQYPFRSMEWPTERFASLSQGDALMFVIIHGDVIYGIKGSADGSQISEMVLDDDFDIVSETLED